VRGRACPRRPVGDPEGERNANQRDLWVRARPSSLAPRPWSLNHRPDEQGIETNPRGELADLRQPPLNHRPDEQGIGNSEGREVRDEGRGKSKRPRTEERTVGVLLVRGASSVIPGAREMPTSRICGFVLAPHPSPLAPGLAEGPHGEDRPAEPDGGPPMGPGRPPGRPTRTVSALRLLCPAHPGPSSAGPTRVPPACGCSPLSGPSARPGRACGAARARPNRRTESPVLAPMGAKGESEAGLQLLWGRARP